MTQAGAATTAVLALSEVGATIFMATESLVLFADESLVRVDGSVALAEMGEKNPW